MTNVPMRVLKKVPLKMAGFEQTQPPIILKG